MALVGAGGPPPAPVGHWAVAVCSLMLWVPVSIQMVLWTMRSMMASAWTPPPRRLCQSFFAYWGLFKVRGEGERRVAGVERPVVLL